MLTITLASGGTVRVEPLDRGCGLIRERGGWWWVVSGDRFRMFPFPSRTAALAVLTHARQVAGSADLMDGVF